MEPGRHRAGRRSTAGPSIERPSHGNLDANIVGFCRLLRRRGLSLGPQEAADALRAVESVDLTDRRDAYVAMRAVLASGQDAQRTLDAAFWEYWGAPPKEDEREQAGPPQGPGQEPLDGQQALEKVLLEWQDEGESADEGERVPAYSPVEALTCKDFSAFTAD